MSSVTKADQLLAKLALETGMTEPGREWLKAALDPFHDTPIACTGYPDTTCGASVVQCYKASATYTCPSSVTSGNWDVAFYMDSSPMQYSLQSFTVVGTTQFPVYSTVAATSLASFGGVSVVGVPSGTPITPYVAPSSGALGSIALPSSFTSGSYRIIAAGFEVVNTTAEINLQGLVTVYRQCTPNSSSAGTAPIFLGSGGLPNTGCNLSSLVCPTPPSTLAQALQLSGTLQWAAKDGCYVVQTMNSTDNPVVSAVTPNPMFFSPGNVQNYMGACILQTGFTGSNLVATPQNIDDSVFNACGAIFTGLSPQTSLNLNVHYYIERFPDVAQTDLVLLATPSPRWDDVALKFYSNAIRDMPVGVKQRDNSLGSWFRGAVQTVRDWFAPLISLIPHPMAQIASRVAYTAGAVADNAGRQGGGGVNMHSQHSNRILDAQMQHALKAPIPKSVKQEVKKEVKREASGAVAKTLKRDWKQYPALPKHKGSKIPMLKS